MFRRLSALSLLLAAFTASPDAALLHAQESAPLVGAVVDAEGRALAGATVVASGPVTRESVTDADGFYRFRPLPSGTYEVAVRGLGYEGLRRSVVIGDTLVRLDMVVDEAPVALDELRVVTTARGAQTAASLPVKVDVVEERDVRLQQTLAANPTELLANVIPSFSPGRQKLTSAGESFRGRRPLFLIDGVPQSNPLRDGRRDGFTIGMDVIERVEVVFGANAIQGLGATGGLVNYITVRPPLTGELEQRLSFGTTTDDGFDADGYGWRGSYLAAKRFDAVDVLASVAWERRGLQFDAEGRPIALDNVQGDIADSESRNVFVKAGWEPDPWQRLQLTVNDFRLAQNGGFVSVAGDRSAGLPAVSEPGTPEGTEPINDVTTASLDYEHTDLLGGTFSAKAYLQDFSALYGGGVFGVFQDPDLAPVGELFDQSENNSEKLGARLTWAGKPVAASPVDVVGGLDLLRDRTFQRLAQTDRNWVPETSFVNYAPFLQADVALASSLTLSAGLRWELAELDVPAFTTLAGNRQDFESVRVEGGSPGFDEPLLNVGGVFRPTEGVRLYGTFAQAFTMPDVGRVLRGISEPGTGVEDFLALEPIQTDNLEFGATHGTARTFVEVTWFRSESDFGSRLVPDEDGIFQVFREPTRTSGWELAGRIRPADRLALSAAYSTLEGRFDGDDDGELESDLGAADIGPDRLNAALDFEGAGRFGGRLQAFHFFDRTFEDADGGTSASFDGYTTVDASLLGRFGASTVTFSVANILDEQYITYYGQAATDRDDRFFAGRGRALTLRLDTRF